MIKVDVDDRQLLSLFAKLDSKKQKKVHKKALIEGAKVLQKETRLQLRRSGIKHTGRKDKWGKSLNSGIKYKVLSDEGVEVHIMGNFKLKFFEKGTKPRYVTTRKGKKLSKKAYRGKNKVYHFFKDAKANKEKEIFDNIDNYIMKNINKISKQ